MKELLERIFKNFKLGELIIFLRSFDIVNGLMQLLERSLDIVANQNLNSATKRIIKLHGYLLIIDLMQSLSIKR